MPRGFTLQRAAGTLLGAQALATLWALVFHLPYEVGGRGSADRVAYDLWTRGTAISAPLPFLAVFALVLLGTYRAGRVGVASTVALAGLTLVALIAGALEPAVRTALHGGFRPLVAIGVLLLAGTSLVVAMFVLVVATSRLLRNFRSPAA